MARGLRHMGVAAVLAAACLALVLASAARSVDVDKDGWNDALLREQPYLPFANVGANCDVYGHYGTFHARLYVRPPRVWGLPGFGKQRVAWRSFFRDLAQNNKVVATGDWIYNTVRERQSTDFGGGPNAPAVMITSNQYWAWSQYFDHLQDKGMRIKAFVEVGWYNARRKKWIYSPPLKVRWVIPTANRTWGEGQTSGSSTPIDTNWDC